MKRTRLLYLSVLLLLTACDSWLEVEAETALPNAEAFATSAKLELAMTGVYHLIKSEDLAGRNWLLFGDCMAGSTNLQFDDFADFNQLTISPFNSRVEGLWTSSYQAINQLNLILAAIDPVAAIESSFTTTEQERLRGEGLFLRSIVYHYLLQYFALPFREEHTDSLGVPLVLEGVSDQTQLSYPARASIQEVMSQIRSDLQQARILLPAHSEAGRVNTYVATACLAKLSLAQAKWSEAAALAQEVMNGPYALTSSPQEFFREEGSPEEIWAAKADPDNPNFAGLNWAYGNARLDSLWIIQTFGQLLLPQQQHALEQAGLSAFDLRADTGLLTNDPLLSPDGRHTYKYEDQFDLADDAPLLRLADIMLLRAEALAQLGESAAAIEVLNRVRRRAFRIINTQGTVLPPEETGNWIDYQIEDLSSEELMDAIARERRAELAFEGHWLHDLIRRGQDIRDSIPWNDPRLRLPIPQRELDANPNLVQNPGF